MEQGFFITGTDTNIGKTRATLTLMHYFQAQGKTVVGMKPVASGCDFIEGKLCNQDALLLQKNASVQLEYELINPFAYQAAISPHLAAEQNPVVLPKIVSVFDVLKQHAQIVLVEGVGGWYVPLNQQGDDVESMASCLGLPVIMVVGMRLGCLNHARLTYQAIINSGLRCAGWLANCVDPVMQKLPENIDWLEQGIIAPLLGVLPYMPTADFKVLAKTIDFAGHINHNNNAVFHTNS